MKKTYMKPELEVVKLNMHIGILTDSLTRNESDAPTTSGEYNSLSREFGWED